MPDAKAVSRKQEVVAQIAQSKSERSRFNAKLARTATHGARSKSFRDYNNILKERSARDLCESTDIGTEEMPVPETVVQAPEKQ